MSLDKMHGHGRIVALSGGIGGAKLALGLARVLPAEDLTIIANTGDDFEHLGLAISPDIDTLAYTLAGLENSETGWGRRNETWSFMTALAALGAETWFRLGDADLAMHVERTRRLRAGDRLTTITADLGRGLGVGPRILPMCDEPVRTRLRTDAGWLDFQDYFVRLKAAPAVREIVYAGAAEAQLSTEARAALADPALTAIVICPSNPLISIGPILAVPGMREALMARQAPVVAVSPIIGGLAVKGPTAKMMGELGMPVASEAVAACYRGLLDAWLVDPADAPAFGAVDFTVVPAQILMRTLADREALARSVIEAAARAAPGLDEGKR